MVTTHLNFVKTLQTPQLWLSAVGLGLAIIHLNITWHSGELSFLGLSVVFWVAISSILWEKRQRLKFDSGTFAVFFGATLLFLLLIKSLFLTGGAYFPRLFPIIAGFSLALIASGFQGIKQYSPELAVLSFFCSVEILFPLLFHFDPAIFTAKFATYLLWYFGVEVTRQGIIMALTTGVVEVKGGCSGLAAMLHLLSLSLLCWVVFSLRWKTKLLLSMFAVMIGFVTNGIRVALMVVLVAAHRQEAFEFWHEGEGSFLFSLASVLLLGGICLVLFEQETELN